MIVSSAKKPGISVTTSFLATLEDTLNAGFTCTSGRKYQAWPDTALNGFEALFDAYRSVLRTGAASVVVLLYDNTTVTITPDELLADIEELVVNYKQASVHNYA